MTHSRRVPRLKWHMLRRRKSDPPFLRENLVAALRAGAACEVDVQLSRDGHALCLHDRTFDRETTGSGRVAHATRSEIERLRQRAPDGAPLQSPPLFVEEVVGAVTDLGVTGRAIVQLDVKVRAAEWSPAALDRLSTLLGGRADAFIASAYDWGAIEAIVGAVPGLHAGYDPLALYPRSFALDADGFRAVASRMRAIAPSASIYYLEAQLVLAALDRGVNLVEAVARDGAQVDAWTIDADHPQLETVLRRLVEAGVHQITSNDPEHLTAIVGDLASHGPLAESTSSAARRAPANRPSRGDLRRARPDPSRFICTPTISTRTSARATSSPGSPSRVRRTRSC